MVSTSRAGSTLPVGVEDLRVVEGAHHVDQRVHRLQLGEVETLAAALAAVWMPGMSTYSTVAGV